MDCARWACVETAACDKNNTKNTADGRDWRGIRWQDVSILRRTQARRRCRPAKQNHPEQTGSTTECSSKCVHRVTKFRLPQWRRVGTCCEKKTLTGWRNVWNMRWRAPDQEVDQTEHGDRLCKKIAKHVIWTQRMLWIVVDGRSW